jgi:sec-independent protein translocase protein TatC
MKSEYDDKRMELTEHLGELRTRIIRCIWYLFLGSVLAYQFSTPIYDFMYRPLHNQIDQLNLIRASKEAKRQVAVSQPRYNPLDMPKPHNPPTVEDLLVRDDVIKWMYTHPSTPPVMGEAFNSFHEMFLVKLQLSIVVGFILVTPLLIREIALFILPALTPSEQRPLRYLAPVSIVCLIMGVSVAYGTLFFAMRWFLSYLDDFPAGATLLQNPGDYILFFVKMMAAFGFAFQLPVVLMAGAFVGIVTSAGLIKHWRWGIVLGVLGGLFTPSNDLISMALMAIPLMLLYFGSIILVKIVERLKARDSFKPA